MLQKCCRNDRRRSIHFSSYASCCITYYETWPEEASKEYIEDALNIVKEGLDDKTLSLSHKNKLQLIELRNRLKNIMQK